MDDKSPSVAYILILTGPRRGRTAPWVRADSFESKAVRGPGPDLAPGLLQKRKGVPVKGCVWGGKEAELRGDDLGGVGRSPA